MTELIRDEKAVLRWAGLAGVIGVIMSVASILAGLFAPPLFVPAGVMCGPACNVDAALPDFPANKAAIIIENMFYFAAVIVFVIFFLGLYRALRVGRGLAPSLFGVGLSFLGLAMESIGALPGVAFAHLSEVYHAAGTPDQATIVLVSHAVQAIFNATDTVGGFLLGIGFVMYGIAMIWNPRNFGRTYGGITIILSVIALGGIALISIATDNPNNPFFVILLLVLPLILGVKLYRLSKSRTVESVTGPVPTS